MKKENLKVVDFFSGTGGFHQVFKYRNHEILTIDADPIHESDIIKPIQYLELNDIPKEFEKPDVILGSPPCKAFSLAGKGSKKNGSDRWIYRDKDNLHPFYGGRIPNDYMAKMNCSNVILFFEWVERLDPDYWFMENPMGGLKTMKFVTDYVEDYNLDFCEITYCRYGENRMKPTDLWGRFPSYFIPRPRCKNGGYGTKEIDGISWRLDPDGFPCHHSASSGSKTGTQALGEKSRYRIPFGLSWDICIACELEFGLDIHRDYNIYSEFKDYIQSSGKETKKDLVDEISEILKIDSEYPLTRSWLQNCAKSIVDKNIHEKI